MPIPFDLPRLQDAPFHEMPRPNQALQAAGVRAGAAMARGVFVLLDCRLVRVMALFAAIIGFVFGHYGMWSDAAQMAAFVAAWVGLREGARWMGSYKVYGRGLDRF